MRNLTRFALFAVLACPLAPALAAGCSGEASSSGSAAAGTASAGTASTGSASTGSASTGSEGAGGTGAGGAGGATGSSTGVGGNPPPTQIATCQGKTYECGDITDNDGDGLIDSQDPDCLGPCDNTENSFYGGIPGQAGPACIVDCYFDSNSGSGNDECYWNHQCDPHEVAPTYYPEPDNGTACAYDAKANTPGTGSSCAELEQKQAQTCHDVCGPLVPNGCDCFGCCELPAGSDIYVWLGSEDKNGIPSCKLADLADPEKCHPCKPVPSCLNTCGKCELCIGKETLPPECSPNGSGGAPGTGGGGGSGAGGSGGGDMQCPEGIQPCGLAGQDACPFNAYCITGCCQIIPN